MKWNLKRINSFVVSILVTSCENRQLLMARASTYQWSSVRIFHSSIATARADFRGLTVIRERSKTFFTHQDLRTQPRSSGTQQNQGTQQSQSQRSNRDKKEKYCRDWNYTAKCDCNSTSASYSSNHWCRVCDTTEHPMLHCPKRKFPIPSTPTNPDSTREWQTLLVALADSVRAAPQYNFQEAKRTLTTMFNLERWNFYLKDYNDVIVTAFLQYGWPISHSADQIPRSTLQNHPSARQHPSLLSDYIAQELKYKAVIGPFQCNPFSTDCVISPLQNGGLSNTPKPRFAFCGMRDVFVATYKVEIKLRRFWVTGSNRNQDLFPFYMPWRHHIWIDKCHYSYRDDLPENLPKNHCTTDVLLSLWLFNKKQTHSSTVSAIGCCEHERTNYSPLRTRHTTFLSSIFSGY